MRPSMFSVIALCGMFLGVTAVPIAQGPMSSGGGEEAGGLPGLGLGGGEPGSLGAVTDGLGGAKTDGAGGRATDALGTALGGTPGQ